MTTPGFTADVSCTDRSFEYKAQIEQVRRWDVVYPAAGHRVCYLDCQTCFECRTTGPYGPVYCGSIPCDCTIRCLTVPGFGPQ
jgi:hypothetical protein